jgi:hypothetical protein
VLGNQYRFDPLDEANDTTHMFSIHRDRGTKPKPDAMKADGVVASHGFEYVQIVPSPSKIVFGVNFTPVDGGVTMDKVGIMRRTKSNTDSIRTPYCELVKFCRLHDHGRKKEGTTRCSSVDDRRAPPDGGDARSG